MYIQMCVFMSECVCVSGNVHIIPPVLSHYNSCKCGGQYTQSSQQGLPWGGPVQCSHNESTTQRVVGQDHSGHPSQAPHRQLQDKHLVWGHRKKTFFPLTTCPWNTNEYFWGSICTQVLIVRQQLFSYLYLPPKKLKHWVAYRTSNNSLFVFAYTRHVFIMETVKYG